MKKLVCILLCGLMLSLTACGGDGASAGGEDGLPAENDAGAQGQPAQNVQPADAGQASYTDEYDAGALFHFGMVPAKTTGKRWGYLNQNGDWAIAPEYVRTYPFSQNGLAFVKTGESDYRIINRDGEFVSDLVLHSVVSISSHTKRFTETDVKRVTVRAADNSLQTEVIHWDGETITELVWDEANGSLGDFSDSGYAIVATASNGPCGNTFAVVDSQLNYTMEPQERFMTKLNMPYGDNRLVAYDNETDTCCILDVYGNVISTLEGVHGSADVFFADNGLAVVSGIGVIDETGSVILPADIYEYHGSVELSYIYSDWMKSSSNGYAEYWDENGTMMFGCEDGMSMKNGLMFAQFAAIKNEQGEVTGIVKVLMDENGEYIVDGESSSSDTVWAVVNEQAEIQYIPKEKGFRSVGCYYSDGYAVAMKKDDDEEYYFVVDQNGDALFEADKDPDRPVLSIEEDENY